MALLLTNPIRETAPINNDEAWKLLESIDTAAPEEQNVMRQKLSSFVENEARAKQTERDNHFKRLYSDLPTLGGYYDGDTQAQLEKVVAGVPDIEAAKARSVNAAYLKYSMGIPDDDLSFGANYESVKSQFAAKHFGKANVSDVEFYNLQKGAFDLEKAQDESDEILLGQAILSDASSGEVLSNWKATLPPEQLKGLDESGRMQSIARIRGAIAPYRDEVRAVFDVLGKYTGATTDNQKQAGGGDIDKLAKSMIGFNRDERSDMYQAVALAVKADGGDVKSVATQLAESFGRGISDITGKTTLAAQELELRQRRKGIETHPNLFVRKGAATGELVPEFGIPSTDEAFASQEFSARRPTAEERVDLIAKTDAALKQVEIVRELRNIADGVVDPIKVKASGWMGDIEGGLYGAARSVPYTLTAALPGGIMLAGVAIAGGEFDRMRTMYPNMAPEAVAGLSVISAALQAPIEKLQSAALFGRMPATAALLKKMGDVRLPLPARLAGAFGGNFIEQNTQELAQDAIPLALDSIAAAVREDMPEFDGAKAFRGFVDSRFDTAMALLPLALIGGGAMSVQELKRGSLYVTDAKTLRMGGFSEKLASDIAAEPDLETKNAMIRENWNKRRDEDIKAGLELAAREADQAKADQENQSKATLEHTAAGEFVVRSVDGRNILTTGDEQAALQAIADANTTSKQADQAVTRELISYYEQTAKNEGREVAFSVENTPKTIADYLASNPESVEQLHERMKIEGLEGVDPAEVSILGETSVEKLRDDVYRTTIKLYEGANAATIVEETVEGKTREALASKRVSMEWLRDQVERYELASGETLLTDSEQSVIEAISSLGVAYFGGKVKDREMPEGLAGFFQQLAVFFKDVFGRALRLKKAISDKKVSADFEEFLADSVGIPVDRQIEREREKAQAEFLAMREEAEMALSEGDGAQGAELLDAISAAGGLPSKESKHYQHYAGELETIRQNAVKTQWKKGVFVGDLFRKEANDPDQLLSSLAEEGFDFETVNDLWDALVTRMRDMTPQFGFRSNDYAYGDTFSIAKKLREPAVAEIDTSTVPTFEKAKDIAEWAGKHFADAGANLISRDDIGEIVIDEKGAGRSLAHGYGKDKIAAFLAVPQIVREGVIVERSQDHSGVQIENIFVGAPIQIDGVDYIGMVRLRKTVNDTRFYVHEVQTKERLQNHQRSASVSAKPQPGFGAAFNVVSEALKVKGNDSFSIASREQLNRIAARLEKLNKSPDERIKAYEGAKNRFYRLLKENRIELQDMRLDGANASKMRRAKLIQAIGELDALLSVLPPEVHVKVGGFTTLTKIGTGDAALGNFFVKRVDMIEREFERALRKEYDAKLFKILARAKPDKDDAGKKPMGKLGADVHALFDVLREAKDWNAAKVEAHNLALQAQIDKGEMTPEEEAHALLEIGLVELVGDWKNADAERMAAAVKELNDVFSKSYRSFLNKKLDERDHRNEVRRMLRFATGRSGSKAERDAKAKADNGLMGTWSNRVIGFLKGSSKDNLLGLLNFEQTAHWVFGQDSLEAQKLADMERNAAHVKQDSLQAKMDGIEALFTKLVGNRYTGQEMRWQMSQDSIKAGGIELSELKAIAATLMWRQEDGRRHMIGHLNENGKPVGEWHYNQAFIDEIEKQLKPRAREVRNFLADQYASEWETLNPIFRDLNGVNMPRNRFYSPLTVKPQQAQGGQSVDPVTGNTFSSGSTTPGSLRNRGTSIAEPDFRDALQTYVAHTKQMEHWKAYAKFSNEARALLGNRELGNSIEAKAGKEAVTVLRGWLDLFAQGGTRDAAAHLALNQWISKASNRAASVALVGRIGTLVIQSTQLAAASAQMPISAYLPRFAKLMAGQMPWKGAFNSPYIQRRLQELPPIVRQAVEGFQSDRPNQLRYAVEKMGQLIGGADALFTAGTYAIVHDYQLAQANGIGLDEAEASAYALEATERTMDRIAQPTRQGTRSLFENTATNPMVRVAWAFASDARKNLALMAYAAAKRPPKEFARTVFAFWIMNGLMAAVIRNAWADARNPDDDEVFDAKNWSLKRMALSIATEPLNGAPLIGSIAQAVAYAGAGEYLPEGNLFSSLERSVSGFKNLASGDATADETFRDLDKILSGMGLLNSNIAAAASISHLARDIFNVGRNAVGTEGQ